ncbi:MAG TPA: hypothetical protein VKQ72_10195, partial [Aggregatilineales bacterium]|nr:hypothetical protein [Aggregatilineales bacterium]
LVDARTKAEVQRIEAQARATTRQLDAQAQVEAMRQSAQADADIQRIKTEAEVSALREREQAAQAYTLYPSLLRLIELETLRELGRNGNARLYINFEGFDSANGDAQLEDSAE